MGRAHFTSTCGNNVNVYSCFPARSKREGEMETLIGVSTSLLLRDLLSYLFYGLKKKGRKEGKKEPKKDEITQTKKVPRASLTS